MCVSGTIGICIDIYNAEQAKRRAHSHAWELAREGFVSISPHNTPNFFTWWIRRKHFKDVRECIENTWKQRNLPIVFGDPSTWPNTQTMSFKEKSQYFMNDTVEYSKLVEFYFF